MPRGARVFFVWFAAGCSVYEGVGGSVGGASVSMTTGDTTTSDTSSSSGSTSSTASTDVGVGGAGGSGEGGANGDGGGGTSGSASATTGGGAGSTTAAVTTAGTGGSAGAGTSGSGGASDASATSAKDAAPDASVAGDAGAICAPGTCKRVFVSSGVPAPSGKLGGVAAIDSFCQSAATAARLGGTWRAWLSDTSSSPSVRFTRATVPYRLLDGSTIAISWTALASGTLSHPINVYEDGTALEAGVTLEVWTATTASGTYSGNACANWTNDTMNSPTGDIGLSDQVNSGWTLRYQQYCNRTTVHVYCFEQ